MRTKAQFRTFDAVCARFDLTSEQLRVLPADVLAAHVRILMPDAITDQVQLAKAIPDYANARATNPTP